MKKKEKELRVVYGLNNVLLWLMERFNPDDMPRSFVEGKFDSIMISFYDHDHRRLSGNWMSNQWNFSNETDDFHFPVKGYEFSNYYARRMWDGIVIDPFENNKLKVKGDVSMSTRMSGYCKITDLNLEHYLWGSTLLWPKIRYVRVAFRNAAITADNEIMIIERGYEADCTGRRCIYPFVERWYEDDYEYPYEPDYYEEDDAYDDYDYEDSYEADYDYDEYEDDDE